MSQIRIAVAVGKFFQKTRRERKISLHTISIQSGIPMNLLVKIESGNILSIKRNTKYIEHITNMIAKNLHVNINEYYPSPTSISKIDEGTATRPD